MTNFYMLQTHDNWPFHMYFQSVSPNRRASSSILIARRGHILGLRVLGLFFFHKKMYQGTIQGNHVSALATRILLCRDVPDAHLAPILHFRILAWSSPLILMTSKSTDQLLPPLRLTIVVDRTSGGHGGPQASDHAGVAEVMCRR